ncbi:MAG: type I restriction-modification system subunit M [Candidatus Nanopelagicales bacterium]|nr:type I restriction-modification system subunit M [Candidatus Nanopelagicales bacterium]
MGATDNWGEMVSFIWSVKEVLRDHYKRHQYGEIILPMVVLRRLDATLAEPSPTTTGKSRRDVVLAKAATLSQPYDRHADLLARSAGLEFYNTSKYDFQKLLGDENAIAENFNDYLNGYSENVREVMAAFSFASHVEKLARAGILYAVIGRFADPKIDLSPFKVSNLEMGYIYEELIRTAAELSNEEAGEHFTPREVIELMVNLLVSDDPDLHKNRRVVTVYDCAAGTGGMLTVAEKKLLSINPTLRVHLRGQEIQEESFAIARSDMLIKGEQTARIRLGDTLTTDKFAGEQFDYCLANPPYGKDWKTVEKKVKAEHTTSGHAGRFGPGLPPTTDGQMLFLLHLLSKMKTPENGGGRVAIVMNGSPLFSGDAGSGPSNIRKHLFENDLVEAIVGLPTDLFYNTGIATYIWVLTNKKAPERQGLVQLLDARDLFTKMTKSLGFKRNLITEDNLHAIVKVYEDFAETDRSLIRPNEAFGFRQITVERPLRVSPRIDDATIDALATDKAITKLPPDARAELLATAVAGLGWRGTLTDLPIMVDKLLAGVVKPAAYVRNAVNRALTRRDPEGEVVTDRHGSPEPDSQLRDYEDIPLSQDVDEYLLAEVYPFAADAWADRAKDRVGYEVPFTRWFYRYSPPRAIATIDADIKASQARIQALVDEVADER